MSLLQISHCKSCIATFGEKYNQKLQKYLECPLDTVWNASALLCWQNQDLKLQENFAVIKSVTQFLREL